MPSDSRLPLAVVSALPEPEVLRNRKIHTNLILMVRDAKLGGKILSDRANSKG